MSGESASDKKSENETTSTKEEIERKKESKSKSKFYLDDYDYTKDCADCEAHKAWITNDIKTIWEKYRDSIPKFLYDRIKTEYDWLDDSHDSDKGPSTSRST